MLKYAMKYSINTNVQGFAEYRTFGSRGQQEGIVALIARRSRLHPGTRYLARGLNSCYSTGALISDCISLSYFVCKVQFLRKMLKNSQEAHPILDNMLS